MSRFLARLLDSARNSAHGMTTGAPAAPVRRTWPEVHAVAAGMAGALRAGADGVPEIGRAHV